ncbi:MAG: hypothetical protein WKG06_45795 [Segetibacter sp.]
MFHIQPGDFYFHNKKEIEATIASQLSRIYQDNYITDEEALLKVDLQEIFDLSFDEMNDYSKVEASISIQKGTDPKHLDVFYKQRVFQIKINRNDKKVKSFSWLLFLFLTMGATQSFGRSCLFDNGNYYNGH